jgi:transcriptional regulator with XRE-family HTH domain
MTPPPLGTLLKRRREARGLTQLELAKRARVAQGYISALEAGEKSNPSVAVIRKLAKALGVPVTELLS